MVKFIETESGMVFSRGWGSGEGKRELWFNRYRFLSWQEEKNSGACLHNNVNTLQSTVLNT